MALNWDISSVKDFEEVTVCHDAYGDNEDLTREQVENSYKTEGLIWLTIGIGMNQITEANAEEFHTRVRMWEDAHGGYLRLGGESYNYTREDIERRIGLGTNASTMTKTQFHKSIIEHYRGKAEWGIRKQQEEAEEMATA